MKCAKLTGIHRLEVIDVPEPEANKGQVIVAMKAVGICGSDVHYYRTGRIGSDACVYPQSLGHECAGEVVTAFEGSKFRPGDRVAVEPARPCMQCEQCLSGHYNCCPHVKFLGSPSMPGAFAERLAIDETQLHKIPDTMSYDEAAILEPLGVAFHTVKLSELQPGATVAIFGTGPIGILTLAMFKACGAGEVFVFDKLQYRLDFAVANYGVDHAVNSSERDPIEYLKSHTRGRGVDITCECAGMAETVQWSFDAARIRGRSMIVGIPEVDSISFNPHPMRRKELLIQNVRRSNMALAPCEQLVTRKQVDIRKLATHHFSLDKIQNAFDTVGNYADGVIRAIIKLD